MDYSPTTAELLDYCRADEDESTVKLMETLKASAVEYLQGAGIDPTESNASRFQLAVKALVLHWYDTPDGGDISPALKQLITQLKY